MFDGRNNLVSWFAHLFNPPPLTSLSSGQKIARSFLVTLTLFVFCLAVAILGTAGLFLIGQARAVVSDQTSLAGTEIVCLAAVVNTLCLRAVLAIKRSA